MSDTPEQFARGPQDHLTDPYMDRHFGVPGANGQGEGGQIDGLQTEVFAAVDRAASRQVPAEYPVQGWTVNGSIVGGQAPYAQAGEDGYGQPAAVRIPWADRRGLVTSPSGAREWLSGVPLRFRVGALAALTAVGLTVAVVEATGGSGGISIEQAATPPQFNYDTSPHVSKTKAIEIQKYEQEAHQLLKAYQPFVEKAANDPRAGDPNALPDNADVKIVYMALLSSATPDAPQGPIAWQGYDSLVQQVNDAAIAKKITLPKLSAAPETTDQSIESNLITTFFALRKSYPVWAAEKGNKDKTVNDFAALFFSGGSNGKQNETLAREESAEWYSPSGVNAAFQKIVATRTSYDSNVLGKALVTMERYGLVPGTGQGNQQG